jgi:hypothetical protein
MGGGGRGDLDSGPKIDFKSLHEERRQNEATALPFRLMLVAIVLTLSAFSRMSFPAIAKILLSILVAVPVCRLATR